MFLCLASVIRMEIAVVVDPETMDARFDNSTGRVTSGGNRKRSCSASPRRPTDRRAIVMAVAAPTRWLMTRPWHRRPWWSAAWHLRPRHRAHRHPRIIRHRRPSPWPSPRPLPPQLSIACRAVTRHRCRRPTHRCPPCRHSCPPATWRTHRPCPEETPPPKWVQHVYGIDLNYFSITLILSHWIGK